MATAAGLLIVTVGFWLLCRVVISLVGRRINHFYPATALYLGGASLLMASICGWSMDTTFTVMGVGPLPIYLAVAPLTVRIDALSSIFVALLGVLTSAVPAVLLACSLLLGLISVPTFWNGLD